MDEVRESRIEVEIYQEKVDFITDAYQKELWHWERAALESVSTDNEAKELIELALPRVILVRKVKNDKIVNIDEIIFYLKSQYLVHNSRERTFIPNIPERRKHAFLWSNNWLFENFFKIYKGGWKHGSQEQDSHWRLVINDIESI